MAKRIFRVDLSEGARDFKPVATEPGLPMLDRANANFAILHRWLGTMAAEPVWIGEDSINVFVLGDEGRLDRIDCVPVTKADLEGPLAADLKTLQARIKKAKPESATEQSLHRVTRQTVAHLANDLDAGGQDSFFFKYRRGKDPWKLVWCWGYQRTDQEPAIASICTNPECHQLFVKRAQNKNKCPGCDETPSARRSSSGAAGGGVFALPAVRYGGIAALALLALFLLLYFGGKAQLVVTPGEITGPAGSKIDYKVSSRRFWIFNSDVTAKVQPQAFDVKLVEFDSTKKFVLGLASGKTAVEFEHSGKKAKADITIGPPNTPKKLVIEPSSLTVDVGGKGECQVIGYYDGDVQIDLTDLATWDVTDSRIGAATDGEVDGFEPGTSKVTVKFRGKAGDKYVEDSIPLEVKYPAGLIVVSPDPVSLAVDETLALELGSSDKQPFVLTSSDPKIVDVQPDNQLVGKGAGLAEITIKQGKVEKVVTVRVKGTPYKSIHIVSDAAGFKPGDTITLKTGDRGKLKVVGRTAAGKETEIPPDKLQWVKQPLAEHMGLNLDTLTYIGLSPTTEVREMAVQVGGELTALAKYEVKKGATSTELIGEFWPHPPIKVGQGNITVNPAFFGKGLKYSDTGGLVITEIEEGSVLSTLGIPKGAMITGMNDKGFEGGITAVREYLEGNPIVDGSRIQYLDPKTNLRKVVTYKKKPIGFGLADVTLQGVKTVDLTAAEFQGELTIQVLEQGDYRLVDSKDKPISKWQTAAAKSTITFINDKIPRTPGDEYDLKVERKIGANVRRFQITFPLKDIK